MSTERDSLVQARRLAGAELDAFRGVSARSWGRTPTVAEHRAFVNARADARRAYDAAVRALAEYDAIHGQPDWTASNRPVPQFQIDAQVWTPADWAGYVRSQDWRDGEWTYDVRRIGYPDRPYRYAEHELEAAR